MSDFTSGFRKTVASFENLPEGSKADYYRTYKREAMSEVKPDWEGFCRDLLQDWPVGDIDGSELFDLALKHGMIREVPGGFNPYHHLDTENVFPEPGDPWYEYTFPYKRRVEHD